MLWTYKRHVDREGAGGCEEGEGAAASPQMLYNTSATATWQQQSALLYAYYTSQCGMTS